MYLSGDSSPLSVAVIVDVLCHRLVLVVIVIVTVVVTNNANLSSNSYSSVITPIVPFIQTYVLLKC